VIGRLQIDLGFALVRRGRGVVVFFAFDDQEKHGAKVAECCSA
jgi:hypothetical protein